MPPAEDCDRNKQHVILATYRCFKRYGIDGTTQKRIAQEACLTPRSIQRYFKDRDELTLETTIYMLRLYDDYVHAYIARKKQPGMTALDEVLLYLECQKEIYLERPGFFLLLNEMDVYYKRHKLHYKALVPKLKQQETMRPFLQSILERGAAEGSIRPLMAVEELRELIIATYTGIFYHFTSLHLETCLEERRREVTIIDTYIRYLESVLLVREI